MTRAELQDENKKLRKIIVDKESAMLRQINEDTNLRRRLDMITNWLNKYTKIAPASLKSHMKSMDRILTPLIEKDENNNPID